MGELAQPHPDRLKVLGLVAGLVGRQRLLPASPRAREKGGWVRRDRDAAVVEVREPKRQAEMEREDDVAALEVALGVEVRRVGHDPPPLLSQCTSQMSCRTGPTRSEAAFSTWTTCSPACSST